MLNTLGDDPQPRRKPRRPRRRSTGPRREQGSSSNAS